MKFKRVSAVLKLPLAAALAASVCFCFSTGISRLEQSHTAEGKRQLETALRQAAAACYAAEGAYPEDLSYLTERYGVQIDEKRYTVYYEIFGSNIMPDITVLENGT